MGRNKHNTHPHSTTQCVVITPLLHTAHRLFTTTMRFLRTRLPTPLTAAAVGAVFVAAAIQVLHARDRRRQAQRTRLDAMDAELEAVMEASRRSIMRAKPWCKKTPEMRYAQNMRSWRQEQFKND